MTNRSHNFEIVWWNGKEVVIIGIVNEDIALSIIFHKTGDKPVIIYHIVNSYLNLS